MIFAQFARHGEMGWDKSDAAYDSIVSLTQIYNVGIQNNGKWNYMMDFKPRNLSVFDKPQIRDFPHEVLQTEEKCAFD